MVKIISCMCNNNGIGINNKLPWSLKEDMIFFKEMTNDCIVIMGRRTFESINKPLKNRINIVISNTLNNNTSNNGVIVFKNLVSALEYYKESIDKIWIIGGTRLYKEALLLDTITDIYITRIYKDFECDTFFPKIPDTFYVSTETSKVYSKNNLEYNFIYYKKN